MPTACTSTGEGHLGKGMGQSLLACTQESHVPHCTEVKCVSPSVVSEPLQPWGLQPARLLCPWDSPGKNTGVGCHFLLQRIFQIQGSNPHLEGLQHCRWILYH